MQVGSFDMRMYLHRHDYTEGLLYTLFRYSVLSSIDHVTWSVRELRVIVRNEHTVSLFQVLDVEKSRRAPDIPPSV